jgi:hypothetical protein
VPKDLLSRKEGVTAVVMGLGALEMLGTWKTMKLSCWEGL